MDHRARRILEAIEKMSEVVTDLDRLQVGDVNNVISPLKHQYIEAIRPIVGKLRNYAQQIELEAEIDRREEAKRGKVDAKKDFQPET